MGFHLSGQTPGPGRLRPVDSWQRSQFCLRRRRYISLLRFTEQGAKDVKKSINRAHEFGKAAAKAGVQIEGQYWTLGACGGAAAS
jgi:hypothetical protein